MTKHTNIHKCVHNDCHCFWCKVSRREPFPTTRDDFDVGGQDVEEVL